MKKELEYLLKRDGGTFTLISVFGDTDVGYKLRKGECEDLFKRFNHTNRLFNLQDLAFFFRAGKKVGSIGGSKGFEYYKEVFLNSLIVDVTGVDSDGFAILKVSDEMKSNYV